jgi:hypothetical protein
MSVGIVVKNYAHYNRAMGKYIGSKKEYEQEMVKGGYVPFEKAEQMAEAARERNTKKYDGLSESKMRFLSQVKDLADKKGNIRTTDRFIKGLKEHGVKVDVNYDKLPKHYRQEGGFNNG